MPVSDTWRVVATCLTPGDHRFGVRHVAALKLLRKEGRQERGTAGQAKTGPSCSPNSRRCVQRVGEERCQSIGLRGVDRHLLERRELARKQVAAELETERPPGMTPRVEVPHAARMQRIRAVARRADAGGAERSLDARDE